MTFLAWAGPVVAILACVVGVWFILPRPRFYVWADSDLESGEDIVHVQIQNFGAADITVNLGEVYSTSAYDSRRDIETHEDVVWHGPELPYRVLGRSGPVRWHAVCKEGLIAPSAFSGSAVMIQTNRRKPRAKAVKIKPPVEWQIKKKGYLCSSRERPERHLRHHRWSRSRGCRLLHWVDGWQKDSASADSQEC
jgi:hypothetical protein